MAYKYQVINQWKNLIIDNQFTFKIEIVSILWTK